MKTIQKLRRQHVEILEICKNIHKLNKHTILNKYPENILSVLLKLSEILNFHFMVEDEYYELLFIRNDINISNLAKKLIDDREGYQIMVKKHSNKWSTEKAIKNDLSHFIEETNYMLNIIYERIKAEENEIFEMIENQYDKPSTT